MTTPEGTSFRLVSDIKQDETACKMPIQKYISNNTGMRLYVCNTTGPVVEGCFSLATEATDDDGLPHTLEHMIFLGTHFSINGLRISSCHTLNRFRFLINVLYQKIS